MKRTIPLETTIAFNESLPKSIRFKNLSETDIDYINRRIQDLIENTEKSIKGLFKGINGKGSIDKFLAGLNVDELLALNDQIHKTAKISKYRKRINYLLYIFFAVSLSVLFITVLNLFKEQAVAINFISIFVVIGYIYIFFLYRHIKNFEKYFQTQPNYKKLFIDRDLR